MLEIVVKTHFLHRGMQRSQACEIIVSTTAGTLPVMNTCVVVDAAIAHAGALAEGAAVNRCTADILHTAAAI